MSMSLIVQILGVALVFLSTVLETAETVDHTECNTSPALVGGRGAMTFHFRKDVDMSLDSFFAYVQREGDKGNVLECDRKAKAPGITCNVLNSMFQSAGIAADHTLAITVPNVTRELEGTYTLRTLVNNTWETPVRCKLTVSGLPNWKTINEEEPIDKKEEMTVLKIIIPVVICNMIAISVAVILVVYCIRRRKRRQLNAEHCAQFPLDDLDNLGERPCDEAADLLSQTWYVGKKGKRAAARLLTSHGKGSFLIRERTNAPDCYKLEVNISDNVESFEIRREDGRFKISRGDEGEAKTFPDLPILVEYYKENTLEFGNDVYDKLDKPAGNQSCSNCV